MRVLVLLAHPRQPSFTGALADSHAAGLAAAGHVVTRGDLTAERFEPRFGADDFGQFNADGPLPPRKNVAREQKRLEANEVLVLAFPVYWWSFPAILKGWIDRLFTEGWAYRFTPERVEGLLQLRKVVLLGSAGSTMKTYRRYGYHGAMQRSIGAGIFGYCGVADAELHVFPQVDSLSQMRPRYLAKARQLGLRMGSMPEDILSVR